MFKAFVTALAVVFLAGSVLAQTPEQAVQDAVTAYAENFNAGSVEGVASTLASRDGFRLVENGRIVFTDKAAAVAALSTSLGSNPHPRMEFEGDIAVTVISAEAATATGAFGFWVADGSGQEQKVFEGAITMTLVPEDGLWRILVMHTSSTAAAD